MNYKITALIALSLVAPQLHCAESALTKPQQKFVEVFKKRVEQLEMINTEILSSFDTTNDPEYLNDMQNLLTCHHDILSTMEAYQSQLAIFISNPANHDLKLSLETFKNTSKARFRVIYEQFNAACLRRDERKAQQKIQS